MAWTLYKEIRYALAGIPSANITDMDQHAVITTDADIAAELGSGGGIKFTSADGMTDLPFGLYPQTSLSAGTIRATFKVSLLTAASVGDVIARLYYSATESTVEDKAGVYSAASAFLDMEQDPSGSAPQMLDWKTETNIGTSQGSMTSGDSVDSLVGKGIDFDGVDDQIDLTGLSAVGTGDFHVGYCYKTSDSSLEVLFGTYPGIGNNFWCGKGQFSLNGSTIYGSILADGDWHSVDIVRESGEVSIYRDGSLIDGPVTLSGTVTNTDYTVGNFSGFAFTGQIDELTFGLTALSAARIAHWHTNRFANSTTFTLSAEQGVGGGDPEANLIGGKLTKSLLLRGGALIGR